MKKISLLDHFSIPLCEVAVETSKNFLIIFLEKFFKIHLLYYSAFQHCTYFNNSIDSGIIITKFISRNFYLSSKVGNFYFFPLSFKIFLNNFVKLFHLLN